MFYVVNLPVDLKAWRCKHVVAWRCCTVALVAGLLWGCSHWEVWTEIHSSPLVDQDSEDNQEPGDDQEEEHLLQHCPLLLLMMMIHLLMTCSCWTWQVSELVEVREQHGESEALQLQSGSAADPSDPAAWSAAAGETGDWWQLTDLLLH